MKTREQSPLLNSGLELNGINGRRSYNEVDIEGNVNSSSNEGGFETERHAEERLFDERNGYVATIPCRTSVLVLAMESHKIRCVYL